MLGMLWKQSTTLWGRRPQFWTAVANNGNLFANPATTAASSSSSLSWWRHPAQQLLSLAQLLPVRGKHTIKTNKSIAKRFRVTGSGKNLTLKRSKSGRQHNTGYKSRARVNKLGQSTTIKEKKHHKKMKQCMGV